jgi:stage VI sporulation protein D
VSETDRNPAIRIHIDQQIFIDAVRGMEEVEDATVVTEVVGFDRNDTHYVLDGALTFTGYIRSTEQQKELTAEELQGDIGSFFEEDELTVQQIHCRMPFTLEVPITAQRTEFLNVLARVGTWNVSVLGPKWIHVRAELVINGLSGEAGYRFRCGTQEEGISSTQPFASAMNREVQEESWGAEPKSVDPELEGAYPFSMPFTTPFVTPSHPLSWDRQWPEPIRSSSKPAAEEPVSQEHFDQQAIEERVDDSALQPGETGWERSPVSPSMAEVEEEIQEESVRSAEQSEPETEEPSQESSITFHFEEIAESSVLHPEPTFQLNIQGKSQQESDPFEQPSSVKPYGVLDIIQQRESSAVSRVTPDRTEPESESQSFYVELSQEAEPIVPVVVQETHVVQEVPVVQETPQELMIDTVAESSDTTDVELEEESSASVTVVTEKKRLNWDEERVYLWTELYPFLEDTFQTVKFRIVQENESMDRIAEAYRLTTLDLMRANHLQSEQIESGQLLYIPNRKR